MGKKKRLRHFGRRIQVCDIRLTSKMTLSIQSEQVETKCLYL